MKVVSKIIKKNNYFQIKHIITNAKCQRVLVDCEHFNTRQEAENKRSELTEDIILFLKEEKNE